MELRGARVTVVGLGASGLAAARLLQEHGAHVVVNDSRTAEQIGRRAAEARALGVELDLGAHDRSRLANSQLLVVSPSVPHLEAFAEADARKIPIISDIELASWFLQGTLVGVTGTHGKSIVAAMLGEMCRRAGRKTFVGGSVTAPACTAVGTDAAQADGIVIVELASLQLERIDRMRAHVGIIVNVNDDHLDRYTGFTEYAAAKARLFATQRPEDVALAPSGDEISVSMARVSPGKVRLFGGIEGEVRRDGEALVDDVSGLRLPLQELAITSDEDLTFASAAALAARMLGIAPQAIGDALRSFQGVPHRMQRVGAVQNVDYYDDSKATSVGAAAAALTGFARQKTKVVLIAGGVDKGGSYERLRAALERSGAGLVLIGEASELIARAFAGSPLPVARASDMHEAVRAAHRLARYGEAVLLAPACASFDMFESYAHRGDVFREAVLALQKEHEG